MNLVRCQTLQAGCLLVALLLSVFFPLEARALEPVSVAIDELALDITESIETYRLNEDSLKISTAPDADGIVRRVEVQAKHSDGVTHWAVFALANTSDQQIDRLIVAPHYRLVNSGLFWPDLDSGRVAAITPSEGFSLVRQKDAEADVFLITLDPGAVITLIAEQRTGKLPKLFLWEPSSYKDTANSYTLYRGIVLGISGLLAVFLTILFVVKGSAMFPATAALAWGVLAYVCVDFGFWNRVVDIPISGEPFWRAGTEVFLAASLVIFLYAYLSLNRWHARFSSVAVGWVLGLIILLGIAIFEPALAAGVARFSFAITSVVGACLIAYLATKRFDRAIMLIPTWLLVLAWVAGAGMTAMGNIANDIIQPALGGGLVLIVLLLGFTVMQHAFSGGAISQGLVSDVERQALALAGSGDIVWDWDVGRDYIATGDEAINILQTERKALNGSPKSWANLLHPNDRDRFISTLEAMVEHKRGRISQSFRLRGVEGQYHWFRLRARPMLDADGDVIRCVGTISDVNAQKAAQERLLQDSVRDNLTGLENRELFYNRLEMVMILARQGKSSRPSVFHINIDEFQTLNTKLGFSVGDTILLTLARRFGRLLKPGDSLARLGGDQFAILLLSETEPKKIAGFADAIRRTLKAPIEFAGQEISLAGSIGIASWTSEHTVPEEMMRDAELAMGQAKRLGGDRIEPFRPAFRKSKDETVVLLEDLKRALERGQISILYQPIVNLRDRSTSGFEALLRWKHPKLGFISPADFIPIAERSGLINQLGLYVISKATADFKGINEITGQNCFVSVNISSRELLRNDIVEDIVSSLKESGLPATQLRIEVTESLVMENPEYSSEILKRIKATGVGISLDDFGTGYSSLSYLLRFPFDTIKIDKSFIQARNQNERLVVLQSIVAMAHGLNQAIIAEGAEYESDVTELMQLGCEYAQGYLFGEPMSAADVERVLLDEHKLAGQ